jgi:2-polyprenyl-6-methoxyphenol hydroxylase-like FAD-dependent oxidoreductase
MSEYPRIAILGAGPVGLTLGALLCKHQIPYTIFDLRPSPISDPTSAYSTLVPSGSLDLHTESGLLALRACGLYEKFCALTSDCSEESMVADMHGEVRWHDNGFTGVEGGESVDGRPEVARNSLMELLRSAVPEENILWEHKILSIIPSSSSSTGTKYTLSYNNPSSPTSPQTAEFDLVFGADGAWSKLRPLLTDTKPHYSTVSCITLTIPTITTSYPHLASLIGKGSYVASAACGSIMAQRGSLDSARLYLMLRNPSETYLQDSGLLNLSTSELKARLLGDESLFANWAPRLKELLAVGCDSNQGEVDARPLYMLPVDHTWTHKEGLTLLGDAAHLMTPFAGEGVNSGMLDAWELVEKLAPVLQSSSTNGTLNGQEGLDGEKRAKIEEALKSYEIAMWARMLPVSEGTQQNLEMIFAENAPEPFVEFFRSHFPSDTPAPAAAAA